MGVARWFQPATDLPKGRWLPLSLIVGLVIFYGGFRLALMASHMGEGPVSAVVYAVVLGAAAVGVFAWYAFCRRRGAGHTS